jgi:predicted NAD-dependent protein-ADP-ribosyltransferase YbiA (DUF1768 family)
MSTITVQSSEDEPFGKLANDAIVPLKIDDKVYPSVVNYVYSNLLPNSTFKEELVTTPPVHVLDTFLKMQSHLKKSSIQSAVRYALVHKAKQVKSFYNKLLETKTMNIVYRSSTNDFLGTPYQDDNNGGNIYGQVLQQVRNEIYSNLQDKDETSRKNNTIYLTWVAEINLKKALSKHNLEKYIVKDKNRTIQGLVEMLEADYGKTKVYSGIPDLETILTLNKKRNIVNYEDPNSLIRIVRKNMVQNILKKNMFDLKNESLRIFVEYLISKNSTLSEDKSKYNEQLSNIIMSKREEMANRIVDMYSAKALPQEVMARIKSLKSTMYFPTDSEIRFFEGENVKVPMTDVSSRVLEKTVDKPVVVESNNTDDILSPMHFCALTIDGRQFTSISQYAAFQVNRLYVTNDNDLYARIKNVKIGDLDRFNKMVEKDHSLKNKLLEIAINFKIKEYHVKNLLFSIKKLNFVDNFDLKKTQYFYDKYRDKIILKIDKVKSFEKFVEEDPFMIDVVKQKVNFYFMILDNLMVHSVSKPNKNILSYNELVELSPFHALSQPLETTPLPKIPKHLLEKQAVYGLSNRSLDIIWAIVYSSIKQCEQIVGKNTYDIRYKSVFIWSKYFLGKFSTYGSSSNLKVMQNETEDVVLMALLAILTKLKEINPSLGYLTMTDEDVQTAVNMCLGVVRKLASPPKIFQELQDYGDLPVEEEKSDNVDDAARVDDDDDDYVSGNDDSDIEQSDYEGFNISTRKNFEAFLKVYFNPVKNESVTLYKLEKAVSTVIRTRKINTALKNQNINFFTKGFELTL